MFARLNLGKPPIPRNTGRYDPRSGIVPAAARSKVQTIPKRQRIPGFLLIVFPAAALTLTLSRVSPVADHQANLATFPTYCAAPPTGSDVCCTTHHYPG